MNTDATQEQLLALLHAHRALRGFGQRTARPPRRRRVLVEIWDAQGLIREYRKARR